MNDNNTKQYPAVMSICTGGGGIERGLELVFGGIELVACCEIESFAVANLVAKIEENKMGAAPIFTDIKELARYAGKFRGLVDIAQGGIPCQPFSFAGNRGGAKDPRHLWPHFETIVNAVQPGIVLIENVEGFITSQTIEHRPDLQLYESRIADAICEETSAWKREVLTRYQRIVHGYFIREYGISVLHYVAGRLEQLGYTCEAGLFSAEEVGAPHQRKRLFILAHKQLAGLERFWPHTRQSTIPQSWNNRWPARPGPQFDWEPPRTY